MWKRTSTYLVIGILGAVLFGLHIEELLKPILWGCVLTLAIAWMLGAKAVVEKCLGLGIGLLVFITVYPGLSYQAREFTHALMSTPGVRMVNVVAVATVALIGVLYVAGKAMLLAPKKDKLPRPTLRQRQHSVEPRPLPRYDASPRPGGRVPSDDDLNLFGREQ